MPNSNLPPWSEIERAALADGATPDEIQKAKELYWRDISSQPDFGTLPKVRQDALKNVLFGTPAEADHSPIETILTSTQPLESALYPGMSLPSPEEALIRGQRALYGGAAGLADFLTSIPGAIQRLAGETPQEGAARGSLVEKLRQAGSDWAQGLRNDMLPPTQNSVPLDVLEGTLRAPADMAPYLLAGEAGVPGAAGMALVDLIRSFGSGKPMSEVAKDTAKGAVMGSVLGATEGLPKVASAPIAGAAGAAMSAVSGASPRDVASSGVVMGILALLGGGKVSPENAIRITDKLPIPDESKVEVMNRFEQGDFKGAQKAAEDALLKPENRPEVVAPPEPPAAEGPQTPVDSAMNQIVSGAGEVKPSVPEAPVIPEPPVTETPVAPPRMSREGFVAAMRRALPKNVSDEQLDALMAVQDAHAAVWGEGTGNAPADYYGLFASINRGTPLEAEALVKGKDLTDHAKLQAEAAAIAQKEGIPLEQAIAKVVPKIQPRGVVNFLQDGRAVIKFFENAQFSTAMHEPFHVFLKNAPPEIQAAAEAIYGPRKNGGWSMKQQEQATFDYETFLSTGKAPRPEMQGIFEKFQQWLAQIYSKIKGTPLGQKLSPEKVAFFEKTLGGKNGSEGQGGLPSPLGVGEANGRPLPNAAEGPGAVSPSGNVQAYEGKENAQNAGTTNAPVVTTGRVVMAPDGLTHGQRYDFYQKQIDDALDAYEKAGGNPIKLFDPNDPYTSQLRGWEDYQPMPPHIAELYRLRDEAWRNENNANVSEISKRFEPLIKDPQERDRLVRQIAEVDQSGESTSPSLYPRREEWRNIGEVVNRITHYLSEKMGDRPETAFHISAELAGDADNPKIVLRMDHEAGLAPSQEVLDEAQRWLNHLYPEDTPQVPGAYRRSGLSGSPAKAGLPAGPSSAPQSVQNLDNQGQVPRVGAVPAGPPSALPVNEAAARKALENLYPYEELTPEESSQIDASMARLRSAAAQGRSALLRAVEEEVFPAGVGLGTNRLVMGGGEARGTELSHAELASLKAIADDILRAFGAKETPPLTSLSANEADLSSNPAVSPTGETPQFKRGDPVQYVASKTGKVFNATYAGKDATTGKDMVRLSDGTLITPGEIRPVGSESGSNPLADVQQALSGQTDLSKMKPPSYPVNIPRTPSDVQQERIAQVTKNPDAYGKKQKVDGKVFYGDKPAIPLAEQRRLAEEMGTTIQEVQLFNESFGGDLAKYVAKSRQNAFDALRELKAKRAEYEEAAAKGRDTSLLKAQVEDLQASALAADLLPTTMGRNIARALRQYGDSNLKPGPQFAKTTYEESFDILKGLLKKAMKRGANKDLIDALKRVDPEDHKAVRDLAISVMTPSLRDKIYEVWVNGILSGPKTHLANVVGNTTALTTRLLERNIATGVDIARAAVTGRPRSLSNYGIMAGLMEGLKKGLASLKEDLSSDKLDFRGKFNEHGVPAIKGKTGEIIRIPTRMLSAIDNLFKVIVGTTEAHRWAASKAVSEGLTGKAFTNRVAEILSATPEKNPALYEAMQKAIRGEAEYLTFTRGLGPVGRKITGLRDATPGLRYVIPFIKTPMNIAAFALERTPVGLLYHLTKGNLRGTDSAKVAEEVSKQIVGGIIMTATAAMVKSGVLTGSGPADYNLNRNKQATGWQPYSMKVGDTYVSYQRLEPLSSVVGMVADMLETKDETKKHDIAAKVINSIATNLTNKTFLQGLENMFLLFSDPLRYTGQMAKGYIGGAMPFSSLLGQAAQAIDPTIRQTEATGFRLGIPDALAAKIPGVSTLLPPKETTAGVTVQRPGPLAARLVSPFPISETKPGANLEREFDALGYVPSKASEKLTLPGGKKVDLTEQDMKLFSQADAKAANRLRKLVDTQGWQGIRNPELKKKKIRMIYDAYRDPVRASLIRKYRSAH